MKKRPKLVPVADDMKHISGLLAKELSQWPAVSMRPMFGLQAFYRGTVIFAMLPDKRAFERPRAIMYKLPAGKRGKEGEKWTLFDLESDRDIAAALACLDQAYSQAVLPVMGGELPG